MRLVAGMLGALVALSLTLPLAAAPLRVVAAGGVPFLVETPGEPIAGLSLDVWSLVAEQAGLDYEVVRVESVEVALTRVVSGQADVAVGPISITSQRAEKVRFTQPYFRAGLAILSRGELSLRAMLEPFSSPAFLGGVGVLSMLLGVVGAVLWRCERRDNPEHFPPTFAAGVQNGIWCALVTMTTVGYGDRVPVTRSGRVVMGIWMLVAVVSLSSLTAGMASAFTSARLERAHVETAEGLSGRSVAAVAGSTGVLFARRQRAKVLEERDLTSCVQRLTAGDVDAVVYDRPMLEHYLNQHPELDAVLSARSYLRQGYGFASRPGSGLDDRINLALLRVDGAGALDGVVSRWLGTD